MATSAELLESLLGGGVAAPVPNGTEELKGLLPMATTASFAFEPVGVFGEGAIVAKPTRNMRPAELIRQSRVIEQATGLHAIVRLESATPYLKRELIASEVAFLIDDGEFFMPAAIRLKPSRKPQAQVARTSLSPTAKTVAIAILLKPDREFTSADVAKELGISPTAAKRALRALLAATPLAKSVAGPTGRTFFYRIDNPEAYAEAVSEGFGPAVRERILIKRKDVMDLPLCGLSALSERSLLSPPKIAQVAAAPTDAAGLRLAAVSNENEDGLAEASVLDYDPTPFVENGLVDAFTMKKTIQKTDERIEAALGEASKEFPWLKLI